MRDLLLWGDRSSLARPVFDEMDRALNEIFGREFFPSAFSKSTYPKMNVYDSNGDLCIDAYVPEVPKEKLSIKIEEGVLTLSGSSETDNKVENSKFYCRELSHRSFSRSVQLPDTVDTEKISADHREGVLRIKVPYKKKEERNKTKEVKIS